MNIQQHLPAPEKLYSELHTRPADAGQALGEHELQTFLLSISSEDGRLTAGCKGEIAFRSAHVSELWDSESHRGEGIGSKLLLEAESLSRTYSCNRIHLETQNENARRLYEKLGYRVFGELHNYEGKQLFYYLEKAIG